jgi:eukaryotic-like serine/threonine-protein kinase
MIGQVLGHCRILARLGKGGMGEVYRAHDSALGRDVALKLLPPELADSEERLERFRREAKALASLNHPNIVTVYSVEEVEGTTFLTMEVLEGETLADYMRGHQASLGEFLRVATPLADAIASAHDCGVIHRDLKPSNIYLTDSGRVKVLDFGLAKVESARDKPDVDTQASTVEALTGEGRVVGTLPYMSPEQLQGHPVDGRSDIFSLGIILYQLATGARPFKGESSAEVISSILRDHPPPVDVLRSDMPHHLGVIVGLCLEVNPDDRIQSAKDLRNQLRALHREVSSAGVAPGTKRKHAVHWGWWTAVGSVLVLAATLLAGRISPPRVPGLALRIPMALPPDLKPALGYGPSVAISPDGRSMAYALESPVGPLLYLKGPTDLDVHAVPGSEGARTPFFSPNGRWVAFFDERQRLLKKASLGGGEPIAIASADYQWGAAWAGDDTIVFSSIYTGLMRVSASGGRVEAVTRAGAFQHSWPSLLPGNKIVFTILEARGSFDRARLAVVDLAGGEPKTVIESGYYPHYSPTGHLVFVQRGKVMAAPFDVGRLEVTGPVVTVLEDLWASPWTGYADFAFSPAGALLYVSGGPDRTKATLERVTRRGEASPILREPLPYSTPRISPDGRRIAFTVGDRDVDLWTYELGRESLTRFTDSPSWDSYPQWQPGQEWIAFSSMREGLPALYRKHLRNGSVEKLLGAEHPIYPSSWSPDGQVLAYTEENPATGEDIWLLSLATGERRAFLNNSHNEAEAAFSPNGRFIAYESDESGRQREVYIRPFPAGEPVTKVSIRGGRSPRWGPRGHELFYWSDGGLMAIPFAPNRDPVPGTPERLFAGSYGRFFDVSPGGDWFLMVNEAARGAAPLRINYVASWLDELERLSPRGR